MNRFGDPRYLQDPFATASPGELLALRAAASVEFCSRITMQDGIVIEGAMGFHPERGASGPIVVSASRNAVMVHRGVLRTDADEELLRELLYVMMWARQLLARGWSPAPPTGNVAELVRQLNETAPRSGALDRWESYNVEGSDGGPLPGEGA